MNGKSLKRSAFPWLFFHFGKITKNCEFPTNETISWKQSFLFIGSIILEQKNQMENSMKFSRYLNAKDLFSQLLYEHRKKKPYLFMHNNKIKCHSHSYNQ